MTTNGGGHDLVVHSGKTQEAEVCSSAADPVFVLAPPCTFSWIICGMLGRHPQMYGLPELHLFTAETMAGWLDLCARESYDIDHGLLRAVAEIYFGTQTEHTIARARGWLARRAHFTTGFLLELLVDRLKPLIPVEKSPSIVFRSEFLERAFRMFPKARFLHLVGHPMTYGESVMEILREAARRQPLPQSHWLLQLASYPRPDVGDVSAGPVLDPQGGWYSLNTTIVAFLKSIPDDQKRTVRGEDLLTDAGDSIPQIAAWLGLRADSEALEEMKHPERSPYACYGPSNAPFGSDIFLLPGPIFRPEWLTPRSLEGPLSWREDEQGLLPEVKELAKQFGYR
jgi:hypothetical protein